MTADISSLFSPGQVLTPADGQAYEEALHRWCKNAEKKAQYVVFPRSAQDVSKAVCASAVLVESRITTAYGGGWSFKKI